MTLCRRRQVDASRVLTSTKEPDWVPATNQSEVSFGIWTVVRHRTGLLSMACGVGRHSGGLSGVDMATVIEHKG